MTDPITEEELREWEECCERLSKKATPGQRRIDSSIPMRLIAEVRRLRDDFAECEEDLNACAKWASSVGFDPAQAPSDAIVRLADSYTEHRDALRRLVKQTKDFLQNEYGAGVDGFSVLNVDAAVRDAEEVLGDG